MAAITTNMKLRFLITILISLLFNRNVAQNTELPANDSLLNALHKHPQKDTTRCMLLITYYEENRNDQDVQHINLELKQLLLEILNTPSLQQTDRKWYIKLLLSVLLYEGQDILKHTANYSRALHSFFEMLKYADLINDNEGRAGAYNDISTTYFKQKYYTESIAYCLKFIDLSRQMNDSIFISSGLSNLAYSYLTINETEKAEKAYKEALRIKARVEPKRLGVIYNGLGNVWRKRGNTDSALYYYKKALDLNTSLHLKRFYVRNYENIALIYLEKKQMKPAEEYALKSLDAARDINEPEHIKSAAGILSEIYQNTGRYKEAYDMIQLSSVMKDSIVNDENKQSLLKAEMNYQTQLKESEIKQLEQQNQITLLQSKQKNTIIYAISALLFILVLSAWFAFSRYKTKKQNELLAQKLENSERLRESERKASDSEIKAIKSQMNPHFFYNALNSIQGYVLSGEPEKASESIGLFSELSRSVLESSRQKEICLADEIELLNNYLKLECMRLPKIHYTIWVAPELNTHDTFIPPMVLQPLAENSIKHGLANKTGTGTVNVRFEKTDHTLSVQIEDDGIGREAAAQMNRLHKRRGSSFSTEANYNRIELLNEHKLNKIRLYITDKKDPDGKACGTLVKVEFPLENDFT